MFGTSEDTFGEGPFGFANWSQQVVYRSLPELHRNIDQVEQDGVLRQFFLPFESELTEIKEAIRTLPAQRNPSVARNGASVPLLLVTSTTPGATTVVDTLTPHGFYPGLVVTFANLETTGPAIRGAQSIARVLSDTSFEVAVATTVPYSSGASPAAYVQQRDASAVLVPVLSATAMVSLEYGRVVEFVIQGNTDLSQLGVGYVAVLEGGGASYTFEVARLRTRNADDSLATRNRVLCYGEAVPSPNFFTAPYVLRFVQPSTLKYLTADFGLVYDENDPEFFQRSLVANVTQYIVRKGSVKGFQIRSEVAGFIAEVSGLYAIDTDSPGDGEFPSWSLLLDDGRWYTTIAPERYRFDEIPADEIFIDPDTGLTFGPMDTLMFEDRSVDGYSEAAAAARCIISNREDYSGFAPYVQSVVAANAAQLEAAMLPYGQVVEVVFGSMADYESFNLLRGGAFALVGPVGGEERTHWIESELAFDVGGIVATYLVGSPDTYPVEYDPLDPSASEYCIRYAPGDASSCKYCKSYKVRLQLTPTPELIASFGGSGAKLNNAVARLLPKLVAEQIPIHVKLVGVAIVIPIEVDASSQVSVTPSITEITEIAVSMQAYYDEVEADVQETDDVGVEVTVGTIVITP